MCMKFPHDHPEWKSQRDAGRLAWKEVQKDKRDAKRKASESGPNPAYSTSTNSSTLSLAKSFKTVLTYRVHMSNVEANYLVDQTAKEAEYKDGAKNPPTKISSGVHG